MKHKAWILVLILALTLAACGADKDGEEEVLIPDTTSGQTTGEDQSSDESGRADQRETSDGVADDVDAPAIVEEIAVEPQPLTAAMPTQAAMAPPPAPPGEAGGGLAFQPQPPADPNAVPPTPDTMFFDDPGTNPFLDTEDDHLSTFAMDVDTGSYTLARNFLVNYNQRPDPDGVRPEEFINYFDAGYDTPAGDDAFAIYLDAAPAPFGYEGHTLMRVGLQGRYVAPEDRDPALLIFVIDVSGSMDREDRLGTVKESLEILVDELREDDRVGIVVYASQGQVVLEPTPASDRDKVMAAIDRLQPSGSTYVEQGLQLAYEMAQAFMREDEITRVITLSDGVANVGETGPEAILETIRDGVEDGITLSMIGFGMGNYNDTLMEQLANDGNGNYFYVDNLREARRVFVHNLTGTLQVIGYDAKVQVDFNPEVTDRYRLVGYENRAIADDQFRDDTVDAGEVGAGHSVTALYELALQDEVDPDDVFATAYIRYEDAETREVVEINRAITVGDIVESIDDAPASFRLQAAVAEFAELLRGSYWAQEGTFGPVLALAEPVAEEMPENEQIAEFVELVQLAIRYGDR